MVGATGALTGPGGEPERVDVSPVTANFLPLLGVDPIYGRHFTAEEEAPGGPKVVILSYGLWKRRYGGDPDDRRRAASAWTASIRPSSA